MAAPATQAAPNALAAAKIGDPRDADVAKLSLGFGLQENDARSDLSDIVCRYLRCPGALL
jgi:hypothetical protein